MNICFVLPIFTRQAQGGYKMVFEYSNRFVSLGHKVDIIFVNENALNQFKVPLFLKKIGANYLTQKEPRWFQLNNSIKKYSSWGNNIEAVINHTEVCIATSIDTIDFVKENFNNCKIVHFIQDHETWICNEKIVNNSYKLNIENIVISEWLQEIVNQFSMKPVHLIKNPIDLNIYRNNVPFKNRKKHSISLLYHTGVHKGVKYAIEVIYKVKKRYPDLTVEMFGIFNRPDKLPDWINYIKGATQQQTVDIYNKTRVYLCASIAEGYGLTGLEAMACGSILVSTNYQGVHEYAKNGYNALLSPVKDVDKLVENISKIFEKDDLAKKIRKNAAESVQEFSWENAVKKFIDILNNV